MNWYENYNHIKSFSFEKKSNEDNSWYTCSELKQINKFLNLLIKFNQITITQLIFLKWKLMVKK